MEQFFVMQAFEIENNYKTDYILPCMLKLPIQKKIKLTFVSSFCSMEEIIRQDALRAPMTFLYATERRFLSSTVSSLSDTLREATFFIASTISEIIHICQNIWMQIFDLITLICYKLKNLSQQPLGQTNRVYLVINHSEHMHCTHSCLIT